MSKYINCSFTEYLSSKYHQKLFVFASDPHLVNHTLALIYIKELAELKEKEKAPLNQLDIFYGYNVGLRDTKRSETIKFEQTKKQKQYLKMVESMTIANDEQIKIFYEFIINDVDKLKKDFEVFNQYHSELGG